MLFRLLPRWETRQLIAASSFILLVACAEKPTAADALPLAPAQPAPVVTVPGATPDVSTEIQPLQTFAQWQGRLPPTGPASRDFTQHLRPRVPRRHP
ncbi:membrane-bound lytic murein transglycosylase [Pseudomonas monteilii]|uniref:Membrane-bound lytic murein transglycosylase n=1 Tax=Pseudomonas monteilii TaxID=76759 RepID=A0AAE6RG17_9PSED|nr:membrane-bound lytic murein transglycosylase [Pseudomonas monteilii]